MICSGAGVHVVCKLWPLLTSWLAVLMLLAALAWAEVNRLGWPLDGAAHSTTMAKPDSRPQHGINTRRAVHFLLTSPFCTSGTHLHTPTNSPPLPGLAHWTITQSQLWDPEVGYICIGWTSAHNKERKKERNSLELKQQPTYLMAFYPGQPGWASTSNETISLTHPLSFWELIFN